MKSAFRVAVTLAGALASASAFAPSSVGRLGVSARTAQQSASRRSDRAGRHGVTETHMDMGVVNTLAGFPLMYGLMSANEYVTHRYYQHNEIGIVLLCVNRFYYVVYPSSTHAH